MAAQSPSKDALWSSGEIIETQRRAEKPDRIQYWSVLPSGLPRPRSWLSEHAAGSASIHPFGWDVARPSAPTYFAPLIVNAWQRVSPEVESRDPVSFRLPIFACKYQRDPTMIVATGALPIAQPAWMATVVARLETLLALPEGWDGYNAKTPEIWHALEAFGFLERVMTETTARPSIVPLTDGGIQIEWHRGDLDIEATFTAGADRGLYLADLSTGAEFEGSIDEGIEDLRRLMARLEEANTATSMHAAH